MFRKAFRLREIGTQIRSIRAKIGDISTSMQTYDIKLVAQGEGFSFAREMQRLRRSYPDDHDEQVITLDTTYKH